MAGQQIRAELTFATDGKEYAPVTTPAPPPGSPTITETFERVSANVYKADLKMNGQTIATLMERGFGRRKDAEGDDAGRGRRLGRDEHDGVRQKVTPTSAGGGVRR